MLLSTVLVYGNMVAAQSRSATPPYLDPKQPVEARVDDLMQRMTLEEKIGQLNLPCGYAGEADGASHAGSHRAGYADVGRYKDRRLVLHE